MDNPLASLINIKQTNKQTGHKSPKSGMKYEVSLQSLKAIKRIVKEYWKQLYSYKFNIKNQHNSLKDSNDPKPIQKEINNLNTLTSTKETELVI